MIQCLDNGMSNKSEIYSKIVDELGVPRPTVRRVAKDLLVEMQQKVTILSPLSIPGKRMESDQA